MGNIAIMERKLDDEGKIIVTEIARFKRDWDALEYWFKCKRTNPDGVFKVVHMND